MTRKLLLIDDDRDLAQLLETFVSRHGYSLIWADRPSAGYQLLGDRPDMILLDVMLDGEDTWNFLAAVKRDPATSDIPVLVCTVMNRESRARARGGRAGGAVDGRTGAPASGS